MKKINILLLFLTLYASTLFSYNLDEKAFLAINGFRNKPFDIASKVFSDAVYIPQFYYIYSLGHGFFTETNDTQNFGIVGVSVSFSTIVTNQIIKKFIKRERPIFAMKEAHGAYSNGFIARLIPTEKYSCPSQSASLAAASATVLATVYPKYDKLFYSLMVLNGWARIYRGAHYPTDVLFGFALGMATAYPIMALLKEIDSDLDVKGTSPTFSIFQISKNF